MSPAQAVGDIGERELIRRLAPWVQFGSDLHGNFGVGDDCALLASHPTSRSVITTDLLLEGTHFIHSSTTNWTGVGHIAAAANLSDLASMGCNPAALLVAVALPATLQVGALLDLYRGIHELSTRYDVPILGGDTTRSDIVCISVTALGWKDTATAACMRSDARPGDNLYVTGHLGESRARLNLVLHPRWKSSMPNKLHQALLESQFDIRPRIATGLAVAQKFPRAAMIDISDGLFNEATLLAEASSVGIEINLDRIPVSERLVAYCTHNSVDPRQFALYSGEEYELLFAVPDSPDQVEQKLADAALDCPATHIGTVTADTGVQLLSDGQPRDSQDATFRHF